MFKWLIGEYLLLQRDCFTTFLGFLTIDRFVCIRNNSINEKKTGNYFTNTFCLRQIVPYIRESEAIGCRIAQGGEGF